MQIPAATILLSAMSLFGGMASAGRDYERRAMKNLISGASLLEKAVEDMEGWSPLPPKASFSQCSLALERVVKQPQSCAMKYMSGPARNVYSPVFNWFAPGGEVTVPEVAQQFALNNGVAVEVYDAFGIEIANVDDAGNILTTQTGYDPEFYLLRTWALNYPTFVREEKEGIASIAQNVWSVRGELFTVVISKNITLLPVVC